MQWAEPCTYLSFSKLPNVRLFLLPLNWKTRLPEFFLQFFIGVYCGNWKLVNHILGRMKKVYRFSLCQHGGVVVGVPGCNHPVVE